MGPALSLLADREELVTDLRPHGALTGDADELTSAGYRLEVACPCGVTFERWVTPQAAMEDLTVLARLNQALDT